MLLKEEWGLHPFFRAFCDQTCFNLEVFTIFCLNFHSENFEGLLIFFSQALKMKQVLKKLY